MSSTMRNMSVNRFNIEMSIFLFLLIFAPPIIPGVNTVFILAAYSTLMLYIKRKDVAKFLAVGKPVITHYRIFLVAVLYIAAVMAISFLTEPINTDNYAKTAYKFFLAGVALPISIGYVVYRLKSKGANFWRLVRLLIYAGLIQAAITSIMLAIPAVRSILLDVMFASNSTDVSAIPFWELERRYYAYSDSVLDTFGLGVGILAALPAYLYTHERTKLIFTIPLLLLVPVFNSVTGLLVFAVGIALIYLPLIRTINRVRFAPSVVATSLIAVVAVSLGAYFSMPEKFEWVTRELGAVATLGQSSGDDITSFSLVFRPTFWVLPGNSSGMLFGEGHTLYEADGFDHSDIGYVNNIWLGGFIGSVLLYGAFVYLFYQAYKYTAKGTQRRLLLFLALAFFIFEIKGYGVGYNPGFSTIMLLMITSLSLSKGQKG